ncbi:MAG: hypothetical protein R2830_11320 [Saprospiraceae bacterium]
MTEEAQKLSLIQMILALRDNDLLSQIRQLLEAKTKPGGIEKPKPAKRQYGFAKGMTLYIAPDFDETPEGFEEYMPPKL